MNEAQLIAKFFSPRIYRSDVIYGVGDDCAVLKAPPHKRLAMTTDTLVEGVHFYPATLPEDLGYKALAVSLSDLAAMGAEPAWVLLSLILPQIDEAWLSQFCRGFYSLADSFSLNLVGGNIAKGPLSITTAVTGFLPNNKGLYRNNAKVGDDVWVTGTLGNAGLGLRVLNKQFTLALDDENFVISCLNRPQPRVKEGLMLRDLANTAIDISDGLLVDLEHIIDDSKVGAAIALADLPLSGVLKNIDSDMAYELALTAGDDYELCFTAKPAEANNILKSLPKVTRIGRIEKQPGLRVYDKNGNLMSFPSKGYSHF